MGGPEEHDAHATNSFRRKKQSHGSNAQQGEKILLVGELGFENAGEGFLFSALTDQGRHEIRQASGIATLQDIDRKSEEVSYMQGLGEARWCPHLLKQIFFASMEHHTLQAHAHQTDQ